MVRISWFGFQLSVIGESQRLNPTGPGCGSTSRMKGRDLCERPKIGRRLSWPIHRSPSQEEVEPDSSGHLVVAP